MTEGSEQTTEFEEPATVPVPVGSAMPPSDDAAVHADDATRPIDLPRQGLRSPQVALVFVSVALAAFLAGIGIGVATRERPDETVVASKVIGRDGGIVRFDRGHIDFPALALRKNTRIVVYRSTFDDRITVQGTDIDAQRFAPGNLVAYRFAPSDVSFGRRVDLVFRLEEGSRNATLFARRGDRIILLGGTVDTARETATTEIRDFRFERERNR